MLRTITVSLLLVGPECILVGADLVAFITGVSPLLLVLLLDMLLQVQIVGKFLSAIFAIRLHDQTPEVIKHECNVALQHE